MTSVDLAMYSTVFVHIPHTHTDDCVHSSYIWGFPEWGALIIGMIVVWIVMRSVKNSSKRKISG